MQKLGIDSLMSAQPTSLELEIAKEKASALGSTGAKLQTSLSKYQQAIQRGATAVEQERLLSEISEDLSSLLVQRELMGLVHENLLWILETNGIPSAVLSRLGLRKEPLKCRSALCHLTPALASECVTDGRRYVGELLPSA